MIRPGLGLVALLALLAVAGCGQPRPTLVEANPASGPDAPTVTATAGTEMSGEGLKAPPPLRLRFDRQELAVHPYAYCFGNGCADGVPIDAPSIGSPSEVEVFVPVAGWELTATFTESGGRCGRAQSVEPAKSDGWYVLHPIGTAGRYDVDLTARGGGDMVARFVWTTPQDGRLATPEATLGLIADHDGAPDSYGVELSLSNLADSPRSAEAQVTVTADNGRSLTFDAHRATDTCVAEGSLFFDGPDSQGLAAAALGGFPFRYDVRLVLDGMEYDATARYPDDEIKGNEPSVRLDFSPPLPALSDQAAR